MPKPHSDTAFSDALWVEAQLNGLTLWQSPALRGIDGLAHAFTSSALNLSSSWGPDAEQAAGARQDVCLALGLDAQQLTCGRQMHGVRVARIAAPVNGPGGPRVLPDTDGLVTTARGVPLLALSADCPLIVLVDVAAGVLGVAHSGWRGSVAGMPGCLVAAMAAQCGARAERMIGVISPCAGPASYEIRDDVRTLVAEAMGDAEPFLARADGRMFLNLPRLIAVQLAAAGVPADRIHVPQQCSIVDERFHSVRRNGPNSGHAGLIAGWV